MRRAGLAGRVAVASALAAAAYAATGHPLLDAIGRPDETYAWRVEQEFPLPPAGTITRVRLTSQRWQGIVWEHELAVIRPQQVRDGSTALLMITGDRGDATVLFLMANVAASLGMPVAVLFDVPNQPLFGGLREDALIAHTFQRFMATGDETWPLLFPMAKSAVRAMDTLQALSAQRWQDPIGRFVVTGASKRGWTTWLTGAADERVAGIAPMVFDNLNLPAQMAQQLAVYGAFSERIRDYTRLGLQQSIDTPRGRRLVEMVDPYAMRDRLELPKLIINGTNDPYWTLESARLYFDELPGPKHLLYVPNGGHGLRDVEKVAATVQAFTAARSQGEELPPLSWAYEERPASIALAIRPGRAAQQVSVWTAGSETRDFRQAQWSEEVLRAEGDTVTYIHTRPEHGFVGILGEVTYHTELGTFSLSTLPRIIGAR